MIRIALLLLVLLANTPLFGQEVIFDKKASLAQVYMDSLEAENVLPMDDLNIASGYVLYETEIITEAEKAVLELENVRDYAVVYLDGKLQGTLTDNDKKLLLVSKVGKHQLQLYVENIGRITYGPEILDNSKGLFGEVSIDGEEIENWKMIPLNIRDYAVEKLTFTARTASQVPGFYKGTFPIQAVRAIYLDVSGWGMGEVWINHKYQGSYWEKEK